MATTAAEEGFYFLLLKDKKWLDQKWPVIVVAENLATPEDRRTRPKDSFNIAVFTIERDNEPIHWATPSQLSSASQSDLIEVATAAAEAGNEQLSHACSQAWEHYDTNYWVGQLESIRAVEALTFRPDSVIWDDNSMDSSRGKRHRSESYDISYDSPSTPKKPRETCAVDIPSALSSTRKEQMPTDTSNEAPRPCMSLMELGQRSRSKQPQKINESAKPFEVCRDQTTREIASTSVSDIAGPFAAKSSRPTRPASDRLHSYSGFDSSESDQVDSYDLGTGFHGYGKWTTAEDAEIIRLREKTKPTPLWRVIAQSLNDRFPPEGNRKSIRTENNARGRWRHMLKEDARSPCCAQLRAEALAHLAKLPDSSVLEMERKSDATRHFTASEDMGIIQPRNTVMPNNAWEQLTDVFNTEFDGNSSSSQNQSKGPVHGQNQRLCSKEGDSVDDEERTQQPLSAFGFRLMGRNPRTFSSAEDAELIRLAKEMSGSHKTWSEIAEAFHDEGKAKGWKERDAGSLRTRYNNLLQTGTSANINCSEVILIDDNNPVPAKPAVNVFGAEEDGELIFLRERFSDLPSWDRFALDYNKKFPQSLCTAASLKARYLKFLQKGEQHIRDSQRNRALDVMKKKGIELEVDDPISEIDSEDDEREEDEDYDKEDGKDDKGDDDNKRDDIEFGDHGQKITILIGAKETPFVVPLHRVNDNLYFMQDTPLEDNGRLIIAGHRFSRIKEEEFRPVHEFLTRGDYAPYLDEDARTFQGITNDDQHASEVIRCGQIFVLARQLLLWDLASLAMRKLQSLRKGGWHILLVAKLVFSEEQFDHEVDMKMRKLVVENVKKRFWDLVSKEAGNMKGTLEKCPLFQVALFGRMAEEGKQCFEAQFG